MVGAVCAGVGGFVFVAKGSDFASAGDTDVVAAGTGPTGGGGGGDMLSLTLVAV